MFGLIWKTHNIKIFFNFKIWAILSCFGHFTEKRHKKSLKEKATRKKALQGKKKPKKRKESAKMRKSAKWAKKGGKAGKEGKSAPFVYPPSLNSNLTLTKALAILR